MPKHHLDYMKTKLVLGQVLQEQVLVQVLEMIRNLV
jgi:hypothetical protein